MKCRKNPKRGEAYVIHCDVDGFAPNTVFLFTGKKSTKVGSNYSWIEFEVFAENSLAWIDWEWCCTSFTRLS